MTTITYANYCLAADTQGETTFIEQDGFQKIYDLKDVFVAGAGITGAVREWIAWYQEQSNSVLQEGTIPHAST